MEVICLDQLTACQGNVTYYNTCVLLQFVATPSACIATAIQPHPYSTVSYNQLQLSLIGIATHVFGKCAAGVVCKVWHLGHFGHVTYRVNHASIKAILTYSTLRIIIHNHRHKIVDTMLTGLVYQFRIVEYSDITDG